MSKACFCCIGTVSRNSSSETTWYSAASPLSIVLHCVQQPSPLSLPSPTKFALAARRCPLFLSARPEAQHPLSFAPTAAPCSFPVGRITFDFGLRTRPPTTGGSASSTSSFLPAWLSLHFSARNILHSTFSPLHYEENKAQAAGDPSAPLFSPVHRVFRSVL
jgi:hypothetical protein